jgi:hypothetical protein
MDLHHSPKSDQTHQSIWRKETQGHLQGLFECLKVIFLKACVDHIEKDQRGLSTSLQARKNSIMISIQTDINSHFQSKLGRKNATLHLCLLPGHGDIYTNFYLIK